MATEFCTVRKKKLAFVQQINSNYHLPHILILSPTFSTFSTLSRTFITLSHTFSTFSTLLHTFSTFSTLSHTFSTLSTLSQTFSTFSTLSLKGHVKVKKFKVDKYF